MIRLVRNLLHTCLCYYDIHDLPPGFRRIQPDEIQSGRPTWIVTCAWCRARFVAAAQPHFDAALAMRRFRDRNADLRDVREVAQRPALRLVDGTGKPRAS